MNKEEMFKSEAYIHYNYFLNVARKMTHNILDAEDLVQDTFIRAFKFINTFQPGTNCRAWLYRIMKNLFINMSRKKNAHPTVNIEDYHYERSSDNYEPEVTIHEIMKLIQEIKDEHRAMIILYHLEEFSLKEISKTLNWPLGTVKSRLHRARREFKKVLEDSIHSTI